MRSGRAVSAARRITICASGVIFTRSTLHSCSLVALAVMRPREPGSSSYMLSLALTAAQRIEIKTTKITVVESLAMLPGSRNISDSNDSALGAFATVQASSSPTGFLCLGFLRWVLGTSGRLAGTVPTRSRAMARTSFFRSKPFCFGMLQCTRPWR